jgi:competence protein ComEC
LLNDLRADVARAEGALRTVRPDDRLDIAGAELRVLHPAEPGWERQRVRNDDSIVLELRYGDVSIVLPGDIGAATEEALARRLSNVPLRVLKAAHHGSASSSSAAWLDAAGPAAVVFSCGRGNRYGHPHPSVLERVRASGAEIFRTDEDGAVTVTTDGHEVWIRGYTGRASRLTANTTKTSKTTKEDTSDVLHAPFRRD